MGSPFKHISQIQSLADFAKLTKQVISKLGEEPVKVHYFAKFKFDKKEAPLLLIGDFPTPVLVEVKKAAGNPVIGQCSLNMAKQLAFEGAVKGGVALKALQAVGIQQAVASGEDDDEKDAASKEKPVVANKPPPIAPVKPPVPVTSPVSKPPVAAPTASRPNPGQEAKGSAPPGKPPAPPNKPPVPQNKPPPPPGKPPVPTHKPPAPPVKPPVPTSAVPPPKAPPPIIPPATPEPGMAIAKRMKDVLPLFQKALDLPGSPETELQQLYKAANDAATAKDFPGANASLDKLETLVTDTLAQINTPAAEVEPEITGEFSKSRKAWQKAMRDAATSIGALQAAILKTKDSRATGLASGFKRILKKLPNPVPSLEALALAVEKKDAAAAEKHKVEAKRLANLCTNYLGTDRLVTLATENPFVPIKLVENFKSALQTLNAELK